MKNARKSILIVLILAISGLGIWGIGTDFRNSTRFDLLFEVLDLIEDYFYQPVDEKKLLEGSIRGLLEGLNDPYSRFMTEEQYRRFYDDLDGEFVGIGIKITIKDGRLIVLSPIKGTPAWKAGIRAGDIILEIDGKSTEGISLDEAVEKLRGEKGTSVRLKVLHEDSTIEEITIIRDVIRIAAVEYELLEWGKIGYLRINTFNRQTAKEVKKVLSKFEGIEGLILDLQNNPGGLLNSAIEVASIFIDEGIILISRSRFGTQSHKSLGNNIKNLPLAVLINKGTASASEIVAGAIQHHKMGILVGRPSFGKGVIQTTFRLKDGSAIILTTAEYFISEGIKIHEIGLLPDIWAQEEDALRVATEWVRKNFGRLCPCYPHPVGHERMYL
jgi:carboxyl-terminal processing protease